MYGELIEHRQFTPRCAHTRITGADGRNRPGVPGIVAAARTQVRRQKLVTAENIKRQKAVVVIIPMKEAPLPHAVCRIVGGIEVQHQSAARGLERGDEPFYQHLVQQHRAAVGGDVAVGEGGLYKAALAAWKTDRFPITIRHGRGVLRVQRNQLNYIEICTPPPHSRNIRARGVKLYAELDR